jgi:hypothetical protein
VGEWAGEGEGGNWELTLSAQCEKLRIENY